MTSRLRGVGSGAGPLRVDGSGAALLALALAALAGCVGTGEGGDDLPDSAALTRSAYAKACSTAEDFLLDQYGGNYFVQALCTAGAIDNNDDAESCAEELDACLNDPPATVQAGIDSILGQAGCDAVAVDPNACSSTVGRLRDCLDALEREIASVKLVLTCAAAGEPLDDWDVIELPAECEELEAECGS